MKKFALFLTGSLLSVQFAGAQDLKQGIALTENDLFERAGQVFYKLISAKPSDPQLYYYMGENFFKSERLDSAKFYYDKGIAADPNAALNYVGNGKLLLAAGKPEEAKALFDKARTLAGPKDQTVLVQIAEAYVSTEAKDVKPAIEVLTLAEQIDSKNTAMYILFGDAVLMNENDGSKALTYYEKAQALEPQSPKPHVAMGTLYERGRSYDLAFQEYNEAVKLDSTFAPSYRKLGDLYYKYNDYAKAKDFYLKYLRLAGNSFSAQVRYAKFLFLAKEYQSAIDEINIIMQKDSTLNILNRLLAYSYYETKVYPEALRYLQKFMTNSAAANTSLIASDYSYYGKILSASGQDSLAVFEFERALAMDTAELEPYNDLANVYQKTKNYDKAIATLQKKMSLVKEPSINDVYKTAFAYYSKGAAMKDSLSFVKADSLFGEVLAKQPDLFQGHLYRARANAGMDPETKYGSAKPYYEKVLELSSLDPVKNKKFIVEAHYYLAYYYFMQSDKETALLNVNKLLEIDPANESAKGLKQLIEKK